jgi:hypothetical protein
MNNQSKAKDGDRFKRALDKQNALETDGRTHAKEERDKAEGEAAKSGLPHLDKHSKGRPEPRR